VRSGKIHASCQIVAVNSLTKQSLKNFHQAAKPTRNRSSVNCRCTRQRRSLAATDPARAPLTCFWISSDSSCSESATQATTLRYYYPLMSQSFIFEKRKAHRASEEKERRLLARIAGLPSVIVALSGGADSAYLAWAAREALGARSLSVTALSSSYSAPRSICRGRVPSASWACATNLPKRHEMENPSYRERRRPLLFLQRRTLFRARRTSAGRTVFCSRRLWCQRRRHTRFSPGHRAATEHQVLAPLLEAGLSKSEFVPYRRRAGLPTWDRPASACLASRLPYGTQVTAERLWPY